MPCSEILLKLLSRIICSISARFPPKTKALLSDMRITPSVVATIISKLDPRNAYGFDVIPAVTLKKCAPELTPVLFKLYNKYLAASCFPACWKFFSLVPVFKNPGEVSDRSNYRPICLLPLWGKFLDALINAGRINHLPSHDLLSDK